MINLFNFSNVGMLANGSQFFKLMALDLGIGLQRSDKNEDGKRFDTADVPALFTTHENANKEDKKNLI